VLYSYNIFPANIYLL